MVLWAWLDRRKRLRRIMRKREERLYHRLFARRLSGWAVWEGDAKAHAVEAVDWRDVVEVFRRENGRKGD